MNAVKKALLALVVAGAITGIWMLLIGGDDVGLAKETLPPIESEAAPVPLIIPTGNSIFECYNLLGGVAQNKQVRLVTDNYGGDVVTVLQLTLMCEQATKTRGTAVFGAFDVPVIFACYRMLRGTDPDDPVELTTTNFGPDVVDVRRAIVMCENATKTRLDIPGSPPVGQPAGLHVTELFQLNGGDDPNAPVILETKNFGRDDVVVRGAIAMMEEAQKHTAAGVTFGAATGRVWECYKLTGGDNPNKLVILETANFGREQVTVGPAVAMCEEAKKRPII